MNLTIITVFIKFSIGLADIFNEMLNPNDKDGVMTMITSIVAVSVICIIFFQWIICVLYSALFNQRKVFNVNMKLIGASDGQLKKIYIKESIKMQIIPIPIGIITAQIICFIISLFYHMNPVLDIKIILVSVLIHVFTLITITLSTINKVSKFSVITELRANDYNCVSPGIKNRYVICFGIGVLGLIISRYVYLNIDFSNFFGTFNGITEMIIFICNFVSFVLISDLIFITLQKSFLLIGKLLKSSSFFISTLITLGYYKKIKPIIIMTIIGVTISTGLQSMFETTRIDAYKSVINNYAYTDKYILSRFVPENTISTEPKLYSSVLIRAEDEKNRKVRVLGIDSVYANNYEQIESNSFFSTDISQMLSSPESDAIYFPDGYITQRDIGGKYTLIYNGNTLTFTIAGSYFLNNIGEFKLLVNKQYLQSVIGETDNINIIYSQSRGIFDELNYDYIQTHITMEEEAQESYDKAISGTTLVVISSMIVFICAVLMLVSFYIITSKYNCIDIVRLKSIGLNMRTIIRIYMMQLINIIANGFLFGIPLSIYFCNVGRLVVLPHRYLVSQPIIPFKFILILIITMFILSFSAFILSTKTSKKSYINLLRDIQQ